MRCYQGRVSRSAPASHLRLREVQRPVGVRRQEGVSRVVLSNFEFPLEEETEVSYGSTAIPSVPRGL
jgi:hypothetical protein